MADENVDPAELVWRSLKLKPTAAASFDSIASVLHKLGFSAFQDEIFEYLSLFDPKNTRKISYKDFESICKETFDPFSDGDSLKSLFAVFDQSKKGKIRAEDIVELSEKYSEPISVEEADELIQSFDKNKDGLIDYKEFANIFTS